MSASKPREVLVVFDADEIIAAVGPRANLVWEGFTIERYVPTAELEAAKAALVAQRNWLRSLDELVNLRSGYAVMQANIYQARDMLEIALRSLADSTSPEDKP